MVHTDQPAPPSPVGELVVQGGRMAGARRALGDPLTVIGSAPGCDVRLNVEGVAPIQCVVLITSDGPLLRELGGDSCRVNGQPVKVQLLRGGDLLEVGPFQLRLELPAPATAELPSVASLATESEREALRIQAAAVVAQQAALIDLEAQLEQRATGLQQQEGQLADHLLSRQRELDEAQRELEAQRQDFAAEQASALKALTAQQAALDRARSDARAELESAAQQRQRLRSLRRRLFQRYQRQTALAVAAAEAEKQQAERVRHQCEAERRRLQSWHEKANTENELLRRQLAEQRQNLALDQQRWEEALNAEKADRLRREKEQATRSAEYLAAREAFAADQLRWQQQQEQRSTEARGLEVRITAQRQELAQLERQATTLRPAPILTEDIIPAAPNAASEENWPERLVQVAGWLGDQRVHLLELLEAFVRTQQTWESERAVALAELERANQSLEQRERILATAERALQARQAELARRQQALDTQRLGVEGLHTRATLLESAARSQQEKAQITLVEAQQQLALRRAQYDRVHLRRNQRREQELARLREALQHADEARRQYALAWQEQHRHRQELEQRERSLFAGETALEAARRELALQSANPAATEGRLERLHQESLAREQQTVQALEAARLAVLQERQRLDGLLANLLRREKELADESERQRREAEAWETARLAGDAQQQRRDQEFHYERARHAIDQRELQQLREELERLAATLIEDSAASEAPEQAPAQHAA